MLYVVLSFLMISLLLYVILAGADFGAGIVELFSTKKSQQITKQTVYRVMGPVWEANHIWIIILIVILWVGFPNFYNVIVLYLHIPLTLILLGITLRGVAFVFRHYDAYKDRTQVLYDWMFRISSLLTPFFLGITFGAIVSGEIIITENYSDFTFYDLFIRPWFNVFSILVGLFFTALCAFLTTVLLIGEAENRTRHIFVKKSKIANVLVIVLGFVVVCYGLIYDITFVKDFIKNPYTLALVFFSGILIGPLLKCIKQERRIVSRALAALQVILILISVFVTHFPNLIIAFNAEINIIDCASTEKVINVLGVSLIIGGLIILPGLFHLFKSFKMIKIFER